MKRLIILLLLVLMVVSVTPSHTTDESYYLYPAISYAGVGTDLPAGEMVEWAIDCTIFFKGVEIRDMIPTIGSILDADIYITRSFTLSEMFDVHIIYTVRASILHSMVYLWNGGLYVNEQNIEEIPRDENSWVQYKWFDASGDWSMGLYAATSGDIRTTDNGILMLLTLLSLGIVVAMTEKGYHWIAKRGRKKND